MLIEKDITPKIQIYRDEKIKLIRYWDDADRTGEWWDVKIDEVVPRCITKDITAKQQREIEDIFNAELIIDELCGY